MLDSKVSHGLMPTMGQVRVERYKKEEQVKFIRNIISLFPAHPKQNKCSAVKEETYGYGPVKEVEPRDQDKGEHLNTVN